MIRLLVVCALLCATGCSKPTESKDGVSHPGDGTVHVNKKLGFSIRLPAGWGAISDREVKARTNGLTGVAGYQILSNEPFEHPFFLVRRLPEKALPKEKLKSAQNIFKSGIVDQHLKAASGMAIETGVPVLEKETGIVWLKFEIDKGQNGTVEGLAAHYYFGDGILQLMSGTLNSDDWPVVERILRSVKKR